MMLLKRFGYTWIFGLMILISCSKDDDSPATPTPTPAPPSSSGIVAPTGIYTRKVLLNIIQLPGAALVPMHSVNVIR
ncbi:MAG: hypothetical protein IPK08_09780 [Bacteroidetes bacterium]|nr:hypothetical protein [Bacteroidota bacterium]